MGAHRLVRELGSCVEAYEATLTLAMLPLAMLPRLLRPARLRRVRGTDVTMRDPSFTSLTME